MLAVLICVAAFTLLVFRFQRQVGESYRYAGRRAAPVRSRILPFPRSYRRILLKYFPYYSRLSHDNRKRFEQRVSRFIYGKRFIPRQVDVVTVEAKVLIAACAVQLTFGLPQDYLGFFSKILVYPNDYYSSITKRFHKGEVNPRFGIIVLSWQSFIDGYLNSDDSRNLGLHEMAHALRLEQLIRSQDYPPFDEELLQQFDDYAHKACNDPAFHARQFFRPYACTNEHEFFSVAVENFFERSDQFQKELPDLYDVLSRLLAQDPLKLGSAD